MAREELNSQFINVNEWHHQFIIPIYSTVMMMFPTSTMWGNIKGQPSMIIIEQATALTILSVICLLLESADMAMAIYQDEKGVDGKKMVMQMIFVNSWFHYILDSPKQGNQLNERKTHKKKAKIV